MDNNNWRPPPPGSEGVPDGGDWRTQLLPESRSRIVNKIMETLKRHLPCSGPDGMIELKKIASRFEEKIYTSVTSQPDYLRKISVKMLTMETKSHANAMPTNSGGNGSRPPDPGMQPQIQNQVQPIPNSLATQSQAHQQMLLQNIQSNLPSSTVQGSAGLSTTLPPGSSLGQISSMQNANMQNMQSGVSQNSLVNTMAQGLNSSMFVGQRQMSGRQQGVSQQQQSQNPQQYLYQQQMHNQLMKLKMQQGNISHPMMTNQIQQQQQPQQQQSQQQNMLQAGQLQHQQSVMQTSSVMQQGPLSGMQQNQQSSAQQSTQTMLQHHQQLRHQQQSQQAIHQQQTALPQQQQITGQQATLQQQTQFSSQQNNMGEMQQPQQQQQQQQQQPKMMSQQNNLQNLQQHQQLAPQTNVSGLHQQMGTQSGNSSIQVGQHPVHMLQSSKVSVQQQMQSGSSNMLQTQGQQPQLQTMQQQLISQMQSQPGQLQQQQVGLPQQQTSLQQRVQASGSLLQQQNMIDQQKQQLFQSQRGSLPETPMESASSQPGHAGGGEWQEELYQKIKAMKDLYFPELNAMYQRIAAKLQQHDSLPQQPKSDQIDKLKGYKQMLERFLSIMQLPKTELVPALKDKLDNYEKQIVSLINMNKPRKMMQQSQMHPHHMSSMQPQQSQSQMGQVSSHENQVNPQMQTSMSLQNPVQPSSISSVAGVSNPQQTMMNSLQHNPSMESGQGNAMGSMQQQQVGVGSMQQNSVTSAQQVNISTMSSQGGLTMLQPNVNNLQTNLNMLQHQNLKHPEQHMLQTQQQLKQQFQQRQMMLQQKQQLIQQHQQQAKQQQQLPAQLQTHQMSQLMNEVADVKLRQGMGVKGVFQHQSSGSRAPYAHQQMKPGSSFPISSPQLLQVASPQLSQHSSPQIDQQNLLTSMTKVGTPLQSANSPFVVPSPSTPLAPSPMPGGDSEKPISGFQPHSNAGNMGHHHISSAPTVTAPSPAIGTPGISASPLLAEFSAPDGAHGNASAAAVSSKSTVTELPIERLMRVVKSLPSQSLSDAVTDISSVVSMVDRIAGSAPGNGSRAAVGEDLVAMTKCRLQARNFMLQDGPTGRRKMRRYTSAMPLNAASSAGSVNDSFKQSMGAEASSDLESTATSSSIKRPRIQGNHALLEQISEINQKLMDTVVDISNEEIDTCAATAVTEGGDGVIVKCSFNAVALSPELKSQYASAQLSPIQPLRLLVPSNYPHCSPILLDKFPVEVSREYEDLSGKAKTRFSICLRSLSQPMSLKDIARTWDDCCRAVILECAEKNGGGSFSSKYGTWESCVSAA